MQEIEDGKVSQNSFRGRVTRKQYLKGFVILILGSLLFFLLDFLLKKYTSFSEGTIENIIIIPAIVYFFIFLSLVIRRLHDLNQSGWVSLGLFIPIANLVLVFYLFFARGNEVKNKYGDRLSDDAKLINILF